MRQIIFLSEEQTNQSLFADRVFDDNEHELVIYSVVQKTTTQEDKELDITNKNVVIKRLSDDKFFFRSLILSPNIRNTEFTPMAGGIL
jgi:glycyl-tRNA synthetase beta subunit